MIDNTPIFCIVHPKMETQVDTLQCSDNVLYSYASLDSITVFS